MRSPDEDGTDGGRDQQQEALHSGLRPATSSLGSYSMASMDGNVQNNVDDHGTRNARQEMHYQTAMLNATRALEETSITGVSVSPPNLPGEPSYSSSYYPSSSPVGTPNFSPTDQLPQLASVGSTTTMTTTTAAATTTTVATTSPVASKSIETQERENFLCFIKILFKILDDAHQPHTKQRAKRIVLECRRKNQLGDPHFHPLMHAVESRLRLFVGESTWRRAHLLLHHYITTKRRATTTTTVGVLSNYNPTHISLTAIADPPRG